MRLFEQEANFIRECGYLDYLRFYNTKDNPPLACRYIERARRLEAVANLLDPDGRYSYYSRRYCETYPDQEGCEYDLYFGFRPLLKQKLNEKK